MSIAKRYIDQKIYAASDIDAAINHLTEVSIRFRGKFRFDLSKMTEIELSCNDRNVLIVNYAYYRITDMQRFKKMNLKTKNTSSMMKIIDMRHYIMGTEFQFPVV